jgi:hypothetical protein
MVTPAAAAESGRQVTRARAGDGQIVDRAIHRQVADAAARKEQG